MFAFCSAWMLALIYTNLLSLVRFKLILPRLVRACTLHYLPYFLNTLLRFSSCATHIGIISIMQLSSFYFNKVKQSRYTTWRRLGGEEI
jgi:hypothetical protein